MLSQVSRPRRRLWIVGGAVLGAIVVLAFVSELVFHQSIDPTEQSFTVTLRNDTSSAVVLKQCDTTCSSFHEHYRLRPGGDVKVNTSAENVANWWLVADEASGRTLGCLPLRYDHKLDGLVVDVSSSVRCPAS